MGKWKAQWLKIVLSVMVSINLASWIGAGSTYAAGSGSEVPKVVNQTSASVVAIIGKPTGSGKAWDKNRYNLAHGTGVIVKSDGVIVTNAHVVKDMHNMVVVTSDGKTYSGRTTHMDVESDLALVKIEATGLSAAKLASSSNIQVGETVAAIGTPISFALRNSVTVGIVSGIERSVNSEYQLIQTDAAINPGNSGGALVNMNGEVIGINTLKYTDLGVESLGFAIPMDTVKYVLDHFERYGKVKRPYLGIELEESWEAVVGLPSSEGLRVAYVDPDSPAAKAGIQQDDQLVSIGGISVKTMVDYNEALKKFLPGDSVSLTLQSAGSTISKQLTLGEVQSKDTQQTADSENAGIDTDRGKTKIGDSHYGWSMKYPAGLVTTQQSDDGNSVTFVDAKGEFYLTILVDKDKSGELSPSALLNKIFNDKDSDGLLERRYVKQTDGPSYAKLLGKSKDVGYAQVRAYQQDGRVYKVSLLSKVADSNSASKQNSLNDLLDSFQLSFDAKDTALKDISVYSEKGNTYTSSFGLSLDLPKDWTKNNYGSSGSTFHNDDFSESISLQVNSASSGDTLKAWVDREKKNFEDTYVPAYREVSAAEEFTLSGVNALKVTYSNTMGDKWHSLSSIYLIKDKYKYQISFAYPKDADAEEINSILKNLISSISFSKESMDPELGFIQDMNDLLDKTATSKHNNTKYKYSLQIPEIWSNDSNYDYSDDNDSFFSFVGGNLEILADNQKSYADTVKDEDAYQKKSGGNDPEYKFEASDVTLFGEAAKKYVVHYATRKMPYKETVYIFRKNNITYKATLNINEAVRTDENEARLNRTFESMTFTAK